MPFSISQLRRWVAVALILVCALVVAAYFYGHHHVKNALKQMPEKMGIEIQQSAQGFTISKSDQGRTLFKLQASKAVQFKSGGRIELHDVAIVLYGRDSSRFDQVYGKDFEYDPQSGDVTSKGDVQIDLQSNPEGLLSSDQTPPQELKNPIHMKTTGLVFNKNSGDAWTPNEIDFSVPQASGSAIGAKYSAQTDALTLQSHIRIQMNGAQAGTLQAEQAVLEKNPREILLRFPHAQSGQRIVSAEQATLFLRDDNSLDHALASGQVLMDSKREATTSKNSKANESSSAASADKLKVTMGNNNQVHTAVLTGNVHLTTEGTQSAEAWANRSEATFTGRNVLSRVHADGNVKLLQKAGDAMAAPNKSRRTQDVEVTALAMNFLVAGGHRLSRVETIGPPEISLLPVNSQSQGQTRITADKFTATFDALGQLSRVHGDAHARVITTEPARNGTPQPDRLSTSDSIDAYFRPGSGIETITQTNHFSYSSGTQKAFADSARYTPANQILVLSGSPRVLDSGMETAADTVRLNRSNGMASAEGNVKTTYNDLKPQPNGALLASSDPIHVTAQNMTAQSSPAKAIYRGSVRLWQDANTIEAPVIDFQKDQRTVIANADSNQPVSTVLFATAKDGKITPLTVTAGHLVYRDAERKAHYDGSVIVHSSDLTVTAAQMDVFLAHEGAASPSQSSNVPVKLEKIIASQSVVVTQPTRRATGDQLTYTTSDDKFVLIGGPPSIFDAEHGKITGVSLTLYRHDDRVIVDGDSRSPAVTHTRMER